MVLNVYANQCFMRVDEVGRVALRGRQKDKLLGQSVIHVHSVTKAVTACCHSIASFESCSYWSIKIGPRAFVLAILCENGK